MKKPARIRYSACVVHTNPKIGTFWSGNYKTEKEALAAIKKLVPAKNRASNIRVLPLVF